VVVWGAWPWGSRRWAANGAPATTSIKPRATSLTPWSYFNFLANSLHGEREAWEEPLDWQSSNNYINSCQNLGGQNP